MTKEKRYKIQNSEGYPVRNPFEASTFNRGKEFKHKSTAVRWLKQVGKLKRWACLSEECPYLKNCERNGRVESCNLQIQDINDWKIVEYELSKVKEYSI